MRNALATVRRHLLSGWSTRLPAGGPGALELAGIERAYAGRCAGRNKPPMPAVYFLLLGIVFFALALLELLRVRAPAVYDQQIPSAPRGRRMRSAGYVRARPRPGQSEADKAWAKTGVSL